MATWAREEDMETADLRDRRLSERLAILLEQMGDQHYTLVVNPAG